MPEAAANSLNYRWKNQETGVAASVSHGKVDLYPDIIERAAQALFEAVFAGCERLDGKHRWTDCDEATREGFRIEATAVIRAIWPLLHDAPF